MSPTSILKNRNDNRASSLFFQSIRLSLDSLPYRFSSRNNTNPLTDQVLFTLAIIYNPATGIFIMTRGSRGVDPVTLYVQNINHQDKKWKNFYF
ncbi:hypothetical protein H8356DRAFT_1327203 [Neocallimastix lanati (nom. inval.)]|nr:hypothetical protein H8356DRAFT_1327203 [Neocallimastix sp. JGI-2020a]